jgi:hypothetical protein
MRVGVPLPLPSHLLRLSTGGVGNQRQRCGLPREAGHRVEVHRLGLKQPLPKEFCLTLLCMVIMKELRAASRGEGRRGQRTAGGRELPDQKPSQRLGGRSDSEDMHLTDSNFHPDIVHRTRRNDV